MKNYTEIKNSGYKSLEIYTGLMAEVIDRMQEADIPVHLIRGKLLAEIKTVLDDAEKKQMVRWGDE